MIAKCDKISHGSAAINYDLNKDRAKTIKIHGMPDNIEAEAMWDRMTAEQAYLLVDDGKPLQADALRFEVSPTPEETKGWTHADWERLADEFIKTYDSISEVKLKKKDNKEVIVPLKTTNIEHSQYIVSLHSDSDSGILHLHILANRVDENGNANEAKLTGLRAVKAANIINQRRGWKQPMERRRENIAEISRTCLTILKEMQAFNWKDYVDRLETKGYKVKLNTDSEGIVRGYTVFRGNSYYKSSLLGNTKDFVPSHIEQTWAKFHYQQPKENPAKAITPAVKSKPKPVFPTVKIPWTRIHANGTWYEMRLSDAVKSEFDAQFADDLGNRDNLFKTAVLLFAGFVNAATNVASSVGGGGDPGTGWGRDKDEDEREWARRCAIKAKWLCKPMHRGVRR